MAFTRFVAALTAACFLALGFQASAAATVIGTQEYLAGLDRAATIDRVQSGFARADVREAMVALGVDPAAAAERVAGLSDAELARVAGQLDELPAGGDLLAVIGIVFVVLLILELTGVIDIFKKM
jgi:hypothetical protein